MLMRFSPGLDNVQVGNIEIGNTKVGNVNVGDNKFNPTIEVAGLLPTAGLQNGEAFKTVMKACCDISTNPHKNEIYGPDAAKALAGNAFPAAHVEGIGGPKSTAAISHKPGGLSV
jgi:hypothetical protein